MENKRLAQLREFLKADPEDAFLLYAVAVEYVGMEDYEKAEEAFLHLQGIHPDYVATYYQLAQTQIKLEDPEAARDAIELGIEKAEKAGNQKAGRELRELLEDIS